MRVSLMLKINLVVLLGVEFTWTVDRFPYYLSFRLDPQNRRGQELLTVPLTMLLSMPHTWHVNHAADHARTNRISQEHRVKESVPLTFIGQQGGTCNSSHNSMRFTTKKYFKNVICSSMRLSETTTNRVNPGYVVARNFCTVNSMDQGYLDKLKIEINQEAKNLLPLLREKLDAGIWPMLHFSKELRQLKEKKQRWLCLTAGKYGLRSIQVEGQFTNWLCSLDLRVSAVESVYRSRGNHTSGVDGIILTRENLISQVNKLNFNQLFKYKSSPIRKVYIPKDKKGELRPLGILTINDRVMQTLFVQLLIL